VEAADAEALRRKGAAIFVDARDLSDYGTSHVKDALPLPGHTMEQLQHLTVRNAKGQHPTVVSLLEAPASMVVVYSDNGSKLSRCVNVSKILRQLLQPERVRRLRGGLNSWKRAGLPVDGDARAMFAGQPADVARLQGGMAELMR